MSWDPVVFIMIDGLRPDVREHAELPAFEALRSRSAWTLRAQSTMPSITLPCHMTIFHSVPPTRHGVTTNVYTPMARPLPGLIDQAKAHEKRCAAIYNWEPLRDLGRPEALEYSWYANLTYQHDGDDILTDAALSWLPTGQPDFLFLYLGTVDTAGHYYGWMSDGYLRQAERVDGQLARILDALPESAHILLQADHGGHDRNHGTDQPEDMTIPWMVSGPRIRENHEIGAPVSLLTTAPMLAALLNIPPHRDWEGNVPDEVWRE
jgi:predicted AlkP superfamily pyrophosphatase or phosphodiesterase